MNPLLITYGPELILALGIIGGLLVQLAPGLGRKPQHLALNAALIDLVLAFWLPAAPVVQATRVLVGGSLVLAIVAALGSRELTGPSAKRATDRYAVGEYTLVLLGLGLGAQWLARATDLLSFYAAMELTALCGYALAGWRAGVSRVAEAGTKYVLFGAVASGVMLFGLSWAYGVTGSLAYGDLPSLTASPIGLTALALIGAGFAVKLALVPFHFAAPDVYEGCPTISAGVLGVVPKVGALAGAIALFGAAEAFAVPGVRHVIAGLAIVTMLAGALTALAATNARRLLAFSGIAHGGMLVLLLALPPEFLGEARFALGFYLLAYAFLTLGAFAAIAALDPTGNGDLRRIAGGWRRAPLVAGGLALFAAALAGIPPLSGFAAKWLLLKAVLTAAVGAGDRWLGTAAVAVLLASAITLFAYLKLVRAALVDGADAPDGVTAHPLLTTVVAVCALATVVLGIGWLAV